METNKDKENSKNFSARIFIRGKCYGFNEKTKIHPPLNDNNNVDTKGKIINLKKYFNRLLQGLILLSCGVMIVLVFLS